jgi:hypothetical protein
MFGRNVSFISFTLSIAFLVSCEESLPPRREPRDFLEASHVVSEAAVEIRDSMVQNTAGTFVVSVKNLYVEVLQEEEFARVDVDVWLRDSASQRANVVALKRDLTNQALVSGGLLTLRPNETATFLKQWSHKTTGGLWFWEFVRLTPKVTPRGERYMESDSVRFLASGRVQLFKTRAPERLLPVQFTLIYRIF